MHYKIRKASSSDAFQLSDMMVEHALFEKHSLIITDQKQKLAQLENLPVHIFVVEQELTGTLLGYISLIKQFSTWDMAEYLYLDCLYLNESCRGQGIGKALMSFALSQAKKMNIQLMQWQTPEDNTSAINFYHTLGATSKAKLRFFWHK